METEIGYARTQVDWTCPHCKAECREEFDGIGDPPEEFTCPQCDRDTKVDFS